MQRKFIRETPECRIAKNFHQQFKRWLRSTFPSEVAMDEHTWEPIMAEDVQHLYDRYPFSNPLEEHAYDTSPTSATSPQIEQQYNEYSQEASQ